MGSLELEPLISAARELETRSCLIYQRGSMVLEYYREPADVHNIGKINSCTKSVLSSLISIAIDQHILPAPDTRIVQFFAELGTDDDPCKREITLRHLLTMSAGFSWSEFGGLNSFPAMRDSPDWVQYVLAQPLAHTPGSRMEYSSGCSQLLAAILRQATGGTVADFAEQRLFGPLGIGSYRWDTDPQGIHTGGLGLYLRPMDMLKFGRLYLQRGEWEGQRLIQPETVRESTSPLLPAAGPQQAFYGWHWWVSSFAADAEGGAGHAAGEHGVANRAGDSASSAQVGRAQAGAASSAERTEVAYHYALGFGGQYIIVVPSYELVAVITADRFKRKRKPIDLFRQYVVPALLRQEQ